MTFQHDLAALKQRLARAEMARDALRGRGGQEQYLEACSRVSALTLQLDRLYLSQPRKATRLPGPGAGD